MCRSLQENVAYEFFLSSLAVPYLSCSSYLKKFVRWEASGSITSVLCGAASGICSWKRSAFWCNFHLAFSLSVLLASMWCIHTVVLTQLQFGGNFILFYRIDETSIWSITCQQNFPPLPCVFLCHFQWMKCCCPIYVNWSTNLKDLPLRVGMAHFCLKLMYSVLLASA